MNLELALEVRADLLVHRMTLDQKTQQIAVKPVANTRIPRGRAQPNAPSAA
ncbi:hypothetical protein [Streptomyces sp. JNUCC 63]